MAHEQTHEHHVQPIGLYAAIYIGLLVLLFLTVAVAKVHLGPLNNTVALAIAVIKALMVILVFMGARFSSRLTWVWATAGFAFLVIMLLTVGDYITRNFESINGWAIR